MIVTLVSVATLTATGAPSPAVAASSGEADGDVLRAWHLLRTRMEADTTTITQPDGKTVTAESCGSKPSHYSSGAIDDPPCPLYAVFPEYALRRYDASGQADPTFGTTYEDRYGNWHPPNGAAQTRFDQDWRSWSTWKLAPPVVAEQRGKILVAGGGRAHLAWGVARFSVDGELDRSFAKDGHARLSDHYVWSSAFWYSSGMLGSYELDDMVVDDQGRVLLVGTTKHIGFPFWRPFDFEVSVARLLPDGLLDPTFGVGGRMIINFAPAWENHDPSSSNYSEDVGHALVLEPDGKILVGGRTKYHDYRWEYPFRPAVARLLPTGILDPTFGTAGIAAPDTGDLPEHVW